MGAESARPPSSSYEQRRRRRAKAVGTENISRATASGSGTFTEPALPAKLVGEFGCVKLPGMVRDVTPSVGMAPKVWWSKPVAQSRLSPAGLKKFAGMTKSGATPPGSEAKFDMAKSRW